MSATEEKPTTPATEEEKMPELEPVTEKKPEEKKPQEQHNHAHDHHDHAHDHEHEDEHDDHKISKAEKKARKAAKALGLHPVPNCTTMTVRGDKGTYFSINSPEVFRVGSSNNYIVFGQMRTEDPTLQAQEEAAKQFGQTPAAQPQSSDITELVNQINKETAKTEPAAEESKADENDEDVDVTGLNPEEVDIVMKQANVSKRKAVDALRKSEGDYIQAIISLTK